MPPTSIMAVQALLLLVALLARPATAVTPVDVSSLRCKNICRSEYLRVEHDCIISGNVKPNCAVRRCPRTNGHRGWICAYLNAPTTPPTPSPSSVYPSLEFTPTPSPTPRVTTVARGCRDRCYQDGGPAYKDCFYNGYKIRGCLVTRCVFAPRRAQLGFKCGRIDEVVTPSISQSPTPIVSTGPIPDDTPEPTPSPGVDGVCYTDPHCRTFDGLYYDCQAIGEFVMAKSESMGFEVQSRFRGPDTNGTVTKGMAVKSTNAPTVQVSIAFTGASNFESIAECPVLMYVDGAVTPIARGTGSDAVTIKKIGTQRLRVVIANGVSIDFGIQTSSKFGCFFENLRVFLPSNVVAAGDVVGLLGSPNGNPFDDWTDASGSAVTQPRSMEDRLFKKAYNYCTRNWCIKTAAKSLFTYETGTKFSDFSFCNTAYGKAPDFSKASAELRELCGDDTACLVDGIAGDINDARNALAVQAEDDASEVTGRPLRFRPSTIAANVPVNVRVTLDLSPNKDRLEGIERFVLYRIDSDSGRRMGSALLKLLDTGTELSQDNVAGDSIFTNVVVLISAKAGERLSFQAYPVRENGATDFESDLVVSALSAVRSYSAKSNLGSVGDTENVVSVDSLVGLGAVAQYSWPNDKPDMDTATRFLNAVVGFDCENGDGSRYLSFSGDDTSEGGTETVGVFLDKARDAGKWSKKTVIKFYAGWYGEKQNGPATLSVALRVEQSGREVRNSGMSLPIQPGFQEDCSSTLVATMDIEVADSGAATLRFLKA